MIVHLLSNPQSAITFPEVHIERDDTWSVDWNLAFIILPMLRQLDATMDHDVAPGTLVFENPNQLCFDFIDIEAEILVGAALFRERLHKMIAAFEAILEGRNAPEEIREGLDLFARHFENLWH